MKHPETDSTIFGAWEYAYIGLQTYYCNYITDYDLIMMISDVA